MAIDYVDRTVGTQEPRVIAGQGTVRTDSPGITDHDARRLDARRLTGVCKRRPLTLLFRGLVAFALLAAGSVITTSRACLSAVPSSDDAILPLSYKRKEEPQQGRTRS